ncbi:MAG: 50S ribosomal protein L29 [Actinomycetota bacterium]|nr:50S ribosomal protein L29 [Actinomycetota bacterium]
MTKAAELRALDAAELADRLADARKELFNLRFQLATGRLDNISRIGTVRKEIARLLTLESERATAAAADAATNHTKEG